MHSTDAALHLIQCENFSGGISVVVIFRFVRSVFVRVLFCDIVLCHSNLI